MNSLLRERERERERERGQYLTVRRDKGRRRAVEERRGQSGGWVLGAGVVCLIQVQIC